MKISLVQCDLKLGDVDYNFNLIEKKIISCKNDNPDIIVLPEMYNTSFFPKNVKEIADVNANRSKELMSRLAKELNVNIVAGSVARLQNDKLYNTSYIFNKKGEEIAYYDKVHAFSPSGEDIIFETGNKICVFEIEDIKCGVVICYDIRFVEWIRMYALRGVEILFVVAAWPDKRAMHWDTLNRSRAIENQMFVVCVNSIGKSGDMKFAGHSAIIDPFGEYIEFLEDKDIVKTSEINLDIIKDIRKNINVFKDRKVDLYKIGGEYEF